MLQQAGRTVQGGSVAERLGLPFVTICNALMLNTELAVPPFFRPWLPRTEWWRGPATGSTTRRSSGS